MKNKSYTIQFVQTCLVLIIIFITNFNLQAKTLYVSTTGDDILGNGSITAPFASIMKAHALVVAGDTVYIRGGVYKMNESQIAAYSSVFAYVFTLDKSGTSASKRICYWAYPGEKPVFDLSNVKPANYRVYVFYSKGSFIHIKGLEVVGTQVTITAHTQSVCFYNEGSSNIFEQLSMHDGMAIGFYLTKGSNNLVLNCDAYNNWDNVSENKKGGNVDGFGFHGNSGSSGNVMRGCRAWFNSDDGYDCINNYGSVTFENCWAFNNGYSSSFASLGDGNGFKAGGYGQAPVVSSLPNPIPSNTIQFCLAYRNKASGFYANHHVVTGNKWYNNTAYRNSYNYNMLSQQISKSTKTGNDTTIDCAGINHILYNNISYRYSSQTETINMGTSTDSNNSFSSSSGIIVNTSDFLSTNESLLVAPRQADGSLPIVDFLRLTQGSDLIDKGKNLGFSFYGAAPDLGAFETNYSTAVFNIENDKDFSIYPNPTCDLINLSRQSSLTQIIDLQGKILGQYKNEKQIDVTFLSNGLYFLKFINDNNEIKMLRFIKK